MGDAGFWPKVSALRRIGNHSHRKVSTECNQSLEIRLRLDHRETLYGINNMKATFEAAGIVEIDSSRKDR